MVLVPDRFWWERWQPAAYRHYVPHPFHIGGYDIVARGTLSIDEFDLEFVRTITLEDRRNGAQFRIIEPEDMGVICEVHPTDQELRDWYGAPGACV